MLFIIFTLLLSVAINYIPNDDHCKITNTTCIYVNVTLHDKTIQNHYMMYRYTILLNSNDKWLKLYQYSFRNQYHDSLKLINHTIPCYRYDNQILTSYPIIMSKQSRYLLIFLIMFIGVMLQFMDYNGLTF